MVSLCYTAPRRDWAANQWDFVLTHFPVDTVYSLGEGVRQYHRPTVIDSHDELPFPLVLMQGREGRYVQGRVPLTEFEHPKDCCYVFGGDDSNLPPEIVADHAVFIPTADNCEMYSFTAAAITLYDRMLKRG